MKKHQKKIVKKYLKRLGMPKSDIKKVPGGYEYTDSCLILHYSCLINMLEKIFRYYCGKTYSIKDMVFVERCRLQWFLTEKFSSEWFNTLVFDKREDYNDKRIKERLAKYLAAEKEFTKFKMRTWQCS